MVLISVFGKCYTEDAGIRVLHLPGIPVYSFLLKISPNSNGHFDPLTLQASTLLEQTNVVFFLSLPCAATDRECILIKVLLVRRVKIITCI